MIRTLSVIPLLTLFLALVSGDEDFFAQPSYLQVSKPPQFFAKPPKHPQFFAKPSKHPQFFAKASKHPQFFAKADDFFAQPSYLQVSKPPQFFAKASKPPQFFAKASKHSPQFFAKSSFLQAGNNERSTYTTKKTTTTKTTGGRGGAYETTERTVTGTGGRRNSVTEEGETSRSRRSSHGSTHGNGGHGSTRTTRTRTTVRATGGGATGGGRAVGDIKTVGNTIPYQSGGDVVAAGNFEVQGDYTARHCRQHFVEDKNFKAEEILRNVKHLDNIFKTALRSGALDPEMIERTSETMTDLSHSLKKEVEDLQDKLKDIGHLNEYIDTREINEDIKSIRQTCADHGGRKYFSRFLDLIADMEDAIHDVKDRKMVVEDDVHMYKGELRNYEDEDASAKEDERDIERKKRELENDLFTVKNKRKLIAEAKKQTIMNIKEVESRGINTDDIQDIFEKVMCECDEQSEFKEIHELLKKDKNKCTEAVTLVMESIKETNQIAADAKRDPYKHSVVYNSFFRSLAFFHNRNSNVKNVVYDNFSEEEIAIAEEAYHCLAEDPKIKDLLFNALLSVNDQYDFVVEQQFENLCIDVNINGSVHRCVAFKAGHSSPPSSRRSSRHSSRRSHRSPSGRRSKSRSTSTGRKRSHRY